MFNKEDIIKYADKLLMGLTDEEAKVILEEFEEIDKNITQINELNLEEIEPAFMPYDLYVAHLREDKPKAGTDIDDILKNAKDVDGREIRVPKVIE